METGSTTNVAWKNSHIIPWPLEDFGLCRRTWSVVATTRRLLQRQSTRPQHPCGETWWWQHQAVRMHFFRRNKKKTVRDDGKIDGVKYREVLQENLLESIYLHHHVHQHRGSSKLCAQSPTLHILLPCLPPSLWMTNWVLITNNKESANRNEVGYGKVITYFLT